jgi:hypothetical protein
MLSIEESSLSRSVNFESRLQVTVFGRCADDIKQDDPFEKKFVYAIGKLQDINKSLFGIQFRIF